jgi:hypothetical protein
MLIDPPVFQRSKILKFSTMKKLKFCLTLF